MLNMYKNNVSDFYLQCGWKKVDIIHVFGFFINLVFIKMLNMYKIMFQMYITNVQCVWKRIEIDPDMVPRKRLEGAVARTKYGRHCLSGLGSSIFLLLSRCPFRDCHLVFPFGPWEENWQGHQRSIKSWVTPVSWLLIPRCSASATGGGWAWLWARRDRCCRVHVWLLLDWTTFALHATLLSSFNF